MHLYQNTPTTGECIDSITTVEDLGRYLQELREKRRVTQASLSVKTAAIAGHKISRSRISEIENARRDRVSERELRVYMVGLKCTPRHIDRMIKALRECAGSLPRELPADPASTRLATPDLYPVGRGGADDDLALRKEKSDGNSTAGGGAKEKRCRRWLHAAAMCINPCDRFAPEPFRGHWQRDRIALAAATVLVIVVFTELSAGFFLRQESVDPPMLPDTPTVLLMPPNAPPVSGNPSSIKDFTFPDRTPVRVDDKQSTKTSRVQRRHGAGDSTSPDTGQWVAGHCCVNEVQRQAAHYPVVSSHVPQDWHSYTDSGRRWQSDPDNEQLVKEVLR